MRRFGPASSVLHAKFAVSVESRLSCTERVVRPVKRRSFGSLKTVLVLGQSVQRLNVVDEYLSSTFLRSAMILTTYTSFMSILKDLMSALGNPEGRLAQKMSSREDAAMLSSSSRRRSFHNTRNVQVFADVLKFSTSMRRRRKWKSSDWNSVSCPTRYAK